MLSLLLLTGHDLRRASHRHLASDRWCEAEVLTRNAVGDLGDVVLYFGQRHLQAVLDDLAALRP